MKERRELKATLMTVGGSLLVWSIQQLIDTQTTEGVIGIFVALLFFWAYEHVQIIERQELAAEFVEDLNGEKVQGFVEIVADRVGEILENRSGGGNDGS